MTPRTAVKEIDEATSSVLAPMTGATAAIAELPHIELPQAIRIERRTGKPRDRLMPKPTARDRITTMTIVPSSTKPDAAIAAIVSEAPSSATATSSNCLALKAMPGRQRPAGSQSVRIASRAGLRSQWLQHRDARQGSLQEPVSSRLLG